MTEPSVTAEVIDNTLHVQAKAEHSTAEWLAAIGPHLGTDRYLSANDWDYWVDEEGTEHWVILM